MSQPIIQLHQLKTQFGTQVVHQQLDLTIYAGERVALVGGSGTGKSVLLNEIALLLRPTAGEIHLFGEPIHRLKADQIQKRRLMMGMMFQQGALFSSLTLLENIMLPLRESQKLPISLLKELAMLKLCLVGLPAQAAHKYPQEISGGMLKRAAVARALALDPPLLLLDEPTAGLDPAGAAAFDQMLLELHQHQNLTLLLVTHDLDSLWTVTNQVAFLGEGRVLCKAPMRELMQHPHPLIQHYFSNQRAAFAYDRAASSMRPV
ncbi:ATP-binding cassette domain-containing protein [Marinospirillum sp. MEB164]|uniref:ATP-binding cassette domain-containing protein n=1 Tax=Marinospirillum alkalitolerans TaxID=3123374 RepID=A0ABW8PVK3_9GAMM